EDLFPPSLQANGTVRRSCSKRPLGMIQTVTCIRTALWYCGGLRPVVGHRRGLPEYAARCPESLRCVKENVMKWRFVPCVMAALAGLVAFAAPGSAVGGDPLPGGAVVRLGTERLRHAAGITPPLSLPTARSSLRAPWTTACASGIPRRGSCCA